MSELIESNQNEQQALGSPADIAVREQALDPSKSFIVQAPAGSGKTELLTRRVLKLLTLVDEPEEVLSITFTRKAASEMRARVVETLHTAASGVPPENAYQREGIELAQAVLKRDAERGWQLLQNTQRLNLRTIDALCTTLAHRLPVVSQLGGPAGLVDDARPLYKRAAEQLLEHRAEELDLLLLQLGNRHEHVQSMLADLLANRDQWSDYVNLGIPHDELRVLLEAKLQQLILSRLDDVNDAIPTETLSALCAVLAKVGPVYKCVLDDSGKAKPRDLQRASVLSAISKPPDVTIDDLPIWDAIAQSLLTASGAPGLRKPRGLNRLAGFPNAAKDAELSGVSVEELKARKERMIELLEDISSIPGIVELLDEVRRLPSGRYEDKDWALLSQLLNMLPALLDNLKSVFAEKGKIDFVEMTRRAQLALGAEDEPTDLALALDMRIKHVLVDEFQDTSRTQFALYRKLVAGWEADDGRTFFAVGDPMQSIYRFREGDVTLFTHAQEQGIGAVQLQPLTLTVNFRAAPAVVDWVNQSFTGVFPEKADDITGAVPYAESIAHLKSVGEVALHGLVDVDVETEAAHVAELTEHALTPTDDLTGNSTVAILLRSRSQAAPIFKALQASGIAYQSVELELLGDRHVVRDLLSLTLALRYPHDRLHWLSILRAPWCGLNLADLHILMDEAKHQTVFDLLHQADRLAVMTEDGQTRVANFLQIISPAVKQASRAALMPWVEACWLQLGGPGICANEIDLDAAERCIARLRTLEQNGELWQPSVLHSSMESLFAASADTEARVQVMTLHKSKGLEFDTVILPALDRKPRGDQQKILNWFESGSDANARLLLAPITERGIDAKNADKINLLVRRAGQQCDEQEKLRLLYVACTRAKSNLHLLARAKTKNDGEFSAVEKRSLLHPLWSLFEEQMLQNASTASDDTTSDNSAATDSAATDHPPPKLRRLPTDWQRPKFNVFAWPEQSVRESAQSHEIEFLWAGTLARDIGTAVHDQMQILSACEGKLREQSVAAMPERVLLQLKNLGVPKESLDAATDKVVRAVNNTLSDSKGQWVLKPDHIDARSEWDLSAPVDGLVKRIKIDRTFVDENDVRWIIDYKTGDHAGTDKEAFLDSEQERYAEQLQGYAQIISRMEQRSVKAALYFPLLQGWREFDLSTNALTGVDADKPAGESVPTQTELF